MIARLARLAVDKPRRAVLTAVTLAILAGLYGFSVEKSLDPYGFADPHEERVRAVTQIKQATGVDPEPQVIILVRRGNIRSAQVQGDISRIKQIVLSDHAVAKVISPTDPANPGAVSNDGRAGYLVVYMRALDEKAQQDAGERLQSTLEPMKGVTLGGKAVGEAEVGRTIADDLKRAELIAFPIILLLSLLFFRSLIAGLTRILHEPEAAPVVGAA